MALSALGLSVNRIAWIASALSVGIGFGLQAIVQNFISGLILLAERPVKVGDWVVLGAAEGDSNASTCARPRFNWATDRPSSCPTRNSSPRPYAT
jgi:hypothetical protein